MSSGFLLGLLILAIAGIGLPLLAYRYRKWRREMEEVFEQKARFFDGR
jgi:hypothetical protein